MTQDPPPHGPDVPPTGAGAPTPQQGPNVPPPPHHQPWAGLTVPTGKPAVTRGGTGLAVASLLLGAAAVVVPLLPFDALGGLLHGGRYRVFGLPLAVAGLAAGLVGCSGQRKGRGLAVGGACVSFVGVLIGLRMAQLWLEP